MMKWRLNTMKVLKGSIVVLKPLIILEPTKRPGTGRFRTTGSNADLTVYVWSGTNYYRLGQSFD